MGEKGPVDVDFVSSPGEAAVIEGLDAKVKQHETMFASLVKHMKDSISMYGKDGHEMELILPEWIYEEREAILCQ